MGIIVRERYPVSALPEDLRAGLDATAFVTVSVTPEAADGEGEDSLLRILDAMRDRAASSDDPVERIRNERAGWRVRETLHNAIRPGEPR